MAHSLIEDEPMQNTNRLTPSAPKQAAPRPIPARAPRPTPAPPPTKSSPPVSAVATADHTPGDSSDVRRSLEELARECRAMAERCEALSKLVASGADREDPTSSAIPPASVRDTVPESSVRVSRVEVAPTWEEPTLRDADVVPGWDDDETTASGWSSAALSYPATERAGAVPQADSEPPSAPLVQCQRCGHANGGHYFSCTACGSWLSVAPPSPAAHGLAADAERIRRGIVGWVKSVLAGRTPRWLDGESASA